MTFQQTVPLYPAPGKEGDLASLNPTAVALPPEGSYKAGANGVYRARWVWVDGTDPTLVNNTGTGLPLGWVMNTGKGVLPLNTTGSMLVEPGTDLGVFTLGDFWCVPQQQQPKDRRFLLFWLMAHLKPVLPVQPFPVQLKRLTGWLLTPTPTQLLK